MKVKYTSYRNFKLFLLKYIYNYLISVVVENPNVELNDEPLDRFEGNTFQNLKVSSPAPVTTDCPSGDIPKYNTRYVCPVKVATFVILGYFHTII